MPRIARRFLRRKEWGSEHKCALRCGYDYFQAGWGDPCTLKRLALDGRAAPEDSANWPDEETLADMQACWAVHGDEVKADHKARGIPGITWGEAVFERGLSPREALLGKRDIDADY